MGVAHFLSNDFITALLMNRTIVTGSTGVPGSTTHAWYGRAKYNGASWEMDGNHSVAGLTTAKLAWNGGNNELDITLVTAEDFVTRPILLATPLNTDAAYWPKCGVTESVGVFTGHVAFYNDAGTRITVEDVNMDVNLTILGQYT